MYVVKKIKRVENRVMKDYVICTSEWITMKTTICAHNLDVASRIIPSVEHLSD
jgi:hypothetical protein